MSTRRPPSGRAVRPPSRRLPLAAVWLLSLLGTAIAGYAAYLMTHRYTGPHHAQFDLKVYYSAVRFWTAGNDIYDYSQPDNVQGQLGFTYPPLAAELMWPMAKLDVQLVVRITVIAIALSTAWCVYVCLRERVRITARNWIWVVGIATGAAFFTEPLRETMVFGQINTFLLALILLDTLVLDRKSSRFHAFTGVGVGLAMAIKLTPGIFLLYFLLARKWRAAATTVATFCLVTLAGAVWEPGATWRYYTSELWGSAQVGILGNSSNESILGLLARWAQPGDASRMLWLACVAVVAWIGIVRIRRAIDAGDTLAAVTLTGLLGILVSPVSWVHHIVWVIPASVIIGSRLLRLSNTAAPPWMWWRPELGWRAREAARLITLVAVGALAFGGDLRLLLYLPITDYSREPWWNSAISSIQMWWVLLALIALPITVGADATRQIRDGERAMPVPPPARSTRSTGTTGRQAQGAGRRNRRGGAQHIGAEEGAQKR